MKIVPAYPQPTHFDIKNDNSFPPKSLVAIKCFAVNGFSKEDVKDCWWNKRLEILMNKKTATDQIEQAVRQIVFEELFDHIQKNNA